MDKAEDINVNSIGVINWLKIKDKVPPFSMYDENSNFKAYFLLNGNAAALENQTYSDWSISVDADESHPSHIRPNVKIVAYGLFPFMGYGNLEDILSMRTLRYLELGYPESPLKIADKYFSSHKRPTPKANNDPEEGSYTLIQSIVSEMLRLLRPIPSRYILSVLNNTDDFENGWNKSLSIFVSDESRSLVTDFFDMFDRLPSVFNEAFYGNSGVLNCFVLEALYLSPSFSKIRTPPTGMQNRNAANERHKGAKMTKEFAIKLYKERTWPSARNASRRIEAEVVAFGANNAEFNFTTDYPHETIVKWLYSSNKPK